MDFYRDNVRLSASNPCFLVKSLAWSRVDCESAIRATVALSAGVWKFVVICAMSTAGGASRMTISAVVYAFVYSEGWCRDGPEGVLGFARR